MLKNSIPILPFTLLPPLSSSPPVHFFSVCSFLVHPLPSSLSLPDRSRTPDELRSILLEEEVRDLRNALANEKNKTSRLMRVIEQRRWAGCGRRRLDVGAGGLHVGAGGLRVGGLSFI